MRAFHTPPVWSLLAVTMRCPSCEKAAHQTQLVCPSSVLSSRPWPDRTNWQEYPAKRMWGRREAAANR